MIKHQTRSSHEGKYYKPFLEILDQGKLAVNEIVATPITAYVSPNDLIKPAYSYDQRTAHIIWNVANLLTELADIYKPHVKKDTMAWRLADTTFSAVIIYKANALTYNLGILQQVHSLKDVDRLSREKNVTCRPHIDHATNITTFKLAITYLGFLNKLANCPEADEFLSMMLSPWKESLSEAPKKLLNELNQYYKPRTPQEKIALQEYMRKAGHQAILQSIQESDESNHVDATPLALHSQPGSNTPTEISCASSITSVEIDRSCQVSNESQYISNATTSFTSHSFFSKNNAINEPEFIKKYFNHDPDNSSGIFHTYLTNHQVKTNYLIIFENMIAYLCLQCGYLYETQQRKRETYIKNLETLTRDRAYDQLTIKITQGLHQFRGLLGPYDYVFRDELTTQLTEFKKDLQQLNPSINNCLVSENEPTQTI